MMERLLAKLNANQAKADANKAKTHYALQAM
jgi:hypothetical protein